jgi:hypothetical protein
MPNIDKLFLRSQKCWCSEKALDTKSYIIVRSMHPIAIPAFFDPFDTSSFFSCLRKRAVICRIPYGTGRMSIPKCKMSSNVGTEWSKVRGEGRIGKKVKIGQIHPQRKEDQR